MNKITISSIVVALALIAAGGAWWLLQQKQPATPTRAGTVEALPISKPPVTLEPEQEPAMVGESDPLTVAPAPSLPQLNDSDSEFLNAIIKRSANEQIASLLVTDEMIRKAVRAIANLSQGQVIQEYRPVMSPGGYLSVNRIEDQAERKRYHVAAKNFSRYEPYLKFLVWLSPKDAADIYTGYLPLFQQAYDELGLREPSFQVAAAAALDNIIEAPRIPGDAVLLSPSVMYVFEENRFESRNAISKLLWRLGSEQDEQVRRWLTEFRSELSAAVTR